MPPAGILRTSNATARIMSLDFLNARRSTPSRALGEPGPAPAQLDELITAAMRVPDHGKLAPWRFIVFEGDARARMGEMLAEVVSTTEHDVSPERRDNSKSRQADAGRFRTGASGSGLSFISPF